MLFRSQVSRGSAGEYQADEQAVSRGSAGEYQADEQALCFCDWNSLGHWMSVYRFSSNLEIFQSLFLVIFFHSSFSCLLQGLNCILRDLTVYCI